MIYSLSYIDGAASGNVGGHRQMMGGASRLRSARPYYSSRGTKTGGQRERSVGYTPVSVDGEGGRLLLAEGEWGRAEGGEGKGDAVVQLTIIFPWMYTLCLGHLRRYLHALF